MKNDLKVQEDLFNRPMSEQLVDQIRYLRDMAHKDGITVVAMPLTYAVCWMQAVIDERWPLPKEEEETDNVPSAPTSN